MAINQAPGADTFSLSNPDKLFIFAGMAFDALLYFPQSQGGPNQEGVRRGGRFLHRALAETLSFHAIAADDSVSEPENDIRHYPALLANLKRCTNWFAQRRPRTVFTLGGDCSIDVGVIDWLHQEYPETLGVVWIDAHADINIPRQSPTNYFHGMPLRLLLGEGDEAMLAELAAPLAHRQLCYVGIRSIDPPEEEYIARHRLPVLSAQQINAGDYRTFARWRAESGIRHLHIHLDLDALDPADAIGVTYKVEGGIRLAAMQDFLYFLHGQGMTVGLTLTEYAPEKEDAEEIGKVLKLISGVLPLPEVLAA